MIVAVDKVNFIVTITFTLDEAKVVKWAMTKYGPLLFNDMIQKWLDGKTAQMTEENKIDIQTRYSALSPADKLIVDAKLGL